MATVSSAGSGPGSGSGLATVSASVLELGSGLESVMWWSSV